LVVKEVTSKKPAASLPEGWRVVRFGDVVRNVDVAERKPLEKGLERYVGLDHLDPESLHIKRWGLIEEGTSFTRKFVERQVLFGKRRAYQRKAAIAEFDGICSGDILVFESKEDDLIPELLPFIVQSDGFFEHALGTSAGSLSPRTKWKDLASYEFALPLKEEQRRIADILWAIDNVIETTGSVLTRLNNVMSAYKGQLIKSRDYKRIPVGQVAKFTSGKAIKVSELPNFSLETPIPVYGGNGIAGYTTVALSGIADRLVIIGRVGQYCGVVTMSTQPCWITDNALYSVSVSSEIDVDYLGICLDAVGLNRQKIGNYLPLINQSVVHDTVIPLPDLSVQKECVLRVESIRSAQQATAAHLETVISMSKKTRAALLPPSL
jgi:type I restriction enzyme S subunit